MTQTQTVTVPPPSHSSSPPEFTIFTRMASIPLISSLDDTLASNAYTRSPYCTAKDLSTTACKYTEPLQMRLAPLIVRADGLANKAVDVVEHHYPYPFNAKPDEVVKLVRERSESAGNYVRQQQQSAVSMAHKTIDERVKSPVAHVAVGIDKQFAPIVDYFEVTVNRMNNCEQAPPSPNAKYQYQRAFVLSMSLKDHLCEYSNEQLKQLQEHHYLVRSTIDAAQSISAATSSSLANAQLRVQELSDMMMQNVQKLQELSIAQRASFESSISSAIAQLQSISAEPIPLNEKMARVGAEVKVRLDSIIRMLGEAFEAMRGRTDAVKANGANGCASGTQ